MGIQVKLALDQNQLHTHAYEFSIQHAETKFTNDHIALALAPFTRYKNLHYKLSHMKMTTCHKPGLAP